MVQSLVEGKDEELCGTLLPGNIHVSRFPHLSTGRVLRSGLQREEEGVNEVHEPQSEIFCNQD